MQIQICKVANFLVLMLPVILKENEETVFQQKSMSPSGILCLASGIPCHP